MHICLAQNEIQRAAEALDAARLQVENEPLWQMLHKEIEERLAHESLWHKAEESFRQGDYIRAEQLLRRVIERQADPRAAALLDAATAELARRSAEQLIHEGRQKVKSLMRKGDPAGALSMVEQLLRECPEDPGLSHDRDEILVRIEVDFVNETLTRLAKLQREENWDAALLEAEKAAARYPGNRELNTALGRVRALALQEQRRNEIARLATLIERAIEERAWTQAEEGLGSAKQRFNAETIFDQLGEKLRKMRRQEELDELSTSVLGCFAAGDLEEAARQIASAEAAFRGEPLWQDLNRQLKLRLAYADALREAGSERHPEITKSVPNGAPRQVIANGAPDTSAATLLHEITAERLNQERGAAISGAREEVSQLVRDGKAAEALGVLDRICRKYPDDAALAGERKDLETLVEQQRQETHRRDSERRKAAERARRIALIRAPVDTAAAERDWAAALAALDTAQHEFPDERVFAELRTYLTQESRRDALKALENAARENFERGDLEEAARCLAAGRPDFSEEPVWRNLNDELGWRRHYQELIAEAEQLLIQGNLETAPARNCARR